jgi:DMSO/TMAO reductase YedYZ molybdopterin-dependent catalytic subunit
MDDQSHRWSGKGGSKVSRRDFLRVGTGIGAWALAARTASSDSTVELPFANGSRSIATYPQKRPLMVLTSRPVQLETPFHVFNEGVFTPNDAFFVRWHLADMPTKVDPATFTLTVRGRVKSPLSLSLSDLKKMDAVEVAAVCQCSGNSRALFEPRVPGGQWGNGAMGNAQWRGVRLKDLLKKADLEGDAQRVRFDGLDAGVSPATPDFKKSIEVDTALGDDIIVAYAMNGEDLPMLNGYPLRLVMPGWYATYWVKMLNDIEVLNTEDDNFWTAKAYKIPDDPCGCVEPGGKPGKAVPINRMTVRSFITSVADGGQVAGGQVQTIKGIAFDGGYGIQRVLFSADGGKTWGEAALGKNHGKYSFREWTVPFAPEKGKSYELMSLAVNTIGQAQSSTPLWNPAGYLRNVIETVKVAAV